jgi:pSer/pThr/pTyr-binding forkhead associated (FHA) protein
MPRLDFYKDHERIVTVRLTAESILIGRSSRCDIQLPDEVVSRRHARILAGPAGDHFIEDLSTNGTRVNAKVIERRVLLSPGDRIYIEDYILIYQPDDAMPESLDAGSTVFMRRPPGLG